MEVLRQEILVKEKKSLAEVRKVNVDGTSGFLRPMPGAARMYPETDLPLLKISRDFINDAKKTLPKSRKENERELEEEGLTREMISILLDEGKIEEYKELLNEYSNPNLAVKMLLIYPKEIASREKRSLDEINEILTKDVLSDVLDKVKRKKVSEGDVKSILTRIVKGEEHEKATSVNSIKEEDEERIMNLMQSKPGLSFNAYMGLVMKEFGSRISGKEAAEIIKKYVK